MLCAHAMPRSDNAALQQRECALYGVGMNVTIDIDLLLVADRLVLSKFASGTSHSLADAMAEIPRGLVADSKHSLNLIRTDSFARFRHQVGNKKPFRQRQMRVVKDSPYRRGELILA